MCQVSVKIRMLTNLRLGDTKKSDKEAPKKKYSKKEIMAVSEREKNYSCP